MAADNRMGNGQPPYNLRFPIVCLDTYVMEAERINAIANRIADLTTREQELRRYL
jgi:hypothetical protein